MVCSHRHATLKIPSSGVRETVRTICDSISRAAKLVRQIECFETRGVHLILSFELFDRQTGKGLPKASKTTFTHSLSLSLSKEKYYRGNYSRNFFSIQTGESIDFLTTNIRTDTVEGVDPKRLSARLFYNLLCYSDDHDGRSIASIDRE